jgi:hypothetical protein
MSIFLGAIKNEDAELVREVILFAENDSRLHDILLNTYLPALERKVKSGKYDYKKAVKLLEYYYQNYVRPSMKNPRNYGYDPKLNPSERNSFAQYFVQDLEDNYNLNR